MKLLKRCRCRLRLGEGEETASCCLVPVTASSSGCCDADFDSRSIGGEDNGEEKDRIAEPWHDDVGIVARLDSVAAEAISILLTRDNILCFLCNKVCSLWVGMKVL